MSVTTDGPYIAGQIVRVATWWINPNTGLLEDGFRDAAGNHADPAIVILKWKTPDGQAHTASGPVGTPQAPVIRSPAQGSVNLGLFQADLDTSGWPGRWVGQWMSPDGDSLQAIQNWAFLVEQPAVP